MRLLQILLATLAGMTAIIAQLVWVRYVTQLLGLSSWTIAAVIGMSLTGLALGNLWGGKKLRSGASIQFASGLLVCCGLTVLLLPALFWLISSIDMAAFSASATDRGSSVNKLWVLAVASPAMLVHFFAGAVFPALLHGRDSTASTAGTIAAAETLGACVGAGLAGCLLIELYGMRLTLLLCGAVAALIGGCAWRLSKLTDEAEDLPPRETTDSASMKFSLRISIAIFLAGIASLGLEVVWQRVLILLVGTDAYSLTIVLVAYLIGVAAGAALAALWTKADGKWTGQKWTMRVAVLQLSGALSSVLVLATLVYMASGPGQAWLNDSIGFSENPLLKRAALCCGLLLFPAAVYGASWPLLLQSLVIKRSDGGLKKSELAALAARVYALVAFGNVAGVILTGFFLVPALGLQVSLLMLAAVTILAVWMLVDINHSRTLVVLTVLLICLGATKWVWLQPIGIASNSDDDLLYYREGPAHTVAVLAKSQQPTHRRLSVDGIVVGQSGDNIEEKQLLLAHLAPLLSAGGKPVEDTVVVGLGSGILSRELAAIGGIASVTSVELSPSVIEAAEEFADLSKPPIAETATVQADGVWWLKKQTRKFDAIISDGKSRPGHVGNSAFFSVDYYRSAADRLAEEGLFIQWVSLDADVRETQIVIRSFGESFPHAYVGIATPNSLYLVGSNTPIKCDPKMVEQYLGSADAQSLKGYFWRTVDDIRAMGWLKMPSFSSDDNATGGGNCLLAQVKTNSLDRPLLERVSFDTRVEKLKSNRVENLEILQELIEQVDSIGLFGDTAQRQTDVKKAIAHLLLMARHEVLQDQGWANKAIGQYLKASETLPNLSRGQYLAKISFAAAVQAAEQNQPDREANLLIQGASVLGDDFDTLMRVAKRLGALSRFEDSARIYSDAVQVLPNDAAANRGLANALLKTGKRKQAARYFRAAGEEAQAKSIEQDLKPPTVEPPIPKVPQPQTDEELEHRLMEILGE